MQRQAAGRDRCHYQQRPEQGVGKAESPQEVGEGFVHSGVSITYFLPGGARQSLIPPPLYTGIPTNAEMTRQESEMAFKEIIFRVEESTKGGYSPALKS